MNTQHTSLNMKIATLLAAAALLAGCTYNMNGSATTNTTETASETFAPEVEASPSSMGSTSYQLNGTTTSASPSPTSDDASSMKKEADNIQIESDFGALAE